MVRYLRSVAEGSPASCIRPSLVSKKSHSSPTFCGDRRGHGKIGPSSEGLCFSERQTPCSSRFRPIRYRRRRWLLPAAVQRSSEQSESSAADFFRDRDHALWRLESAGFSSGDRLVISESRSWTDIVIRPKKITDRKRPSHGAPTRAPDSGADHRPYRDDSPELFC